MMPRKNTRPAARKARARLKAKIAQKQKPQRVIAIAHPGRGSLALLAATMAANAHSEGRGDR